MAHNGESTPTRRGMLGTIAGVAIGAAMPVSAAALRPAETVNTPVPDDAIVVRMSPRKQFRVTFPHSPGDGWVDQGYLSGEIVSVQIGTSLRDGSRWREMLAMQRSDVTVMPDWRIWPSSAESWRWQSVTA